MNAPRVLALLLAMTPALVMAGQATPACYDAPTQGGLNACAAGQQGQADAELNRVWQAIGRKYHDQPVFLAKLTAAQRLWLKFRDAELAAEFPLAAGQDARSQYGSAYPMCLSQAQEALTRQRIQQLKAWLDGAQEGDVCAGSLKNSSELK